MIERKFGICYNHKAGKDKILRCVKPAKTCMLNA